MNLLISPVSFFESTLESLSESPSRSDVVTVVVVLALIAHHFFRRFETYSLFIHVSLLLVPPGILSGYVVSRPSSTWTVLNAFFFICPIYLSALSTSVLLYRLSPFHPLARYPGPLKCKVSKLWMARLSLEGHQHRYIKTLHDRYGDFVRIGPNELSIRDPSVIPQLLGPSGLPKGPHLIGRSLNPKILMVIAMQNTDYHLQRRKPWTRGLSPGAIKDYEERIALHTKRLVWKLKAAGEFTLNECIDSFAYDFMSDMALGESLSDLSSEREPDQFWSSLEDSVPIATFFGHVPWLGVYMGKVPAAADQIQKLIAYCRTRAQERLKRSPVLKKDLFHYLNYEDDPEVEPPPLQQLVDDGITAMIAGADTVSSALTSLFGCLMAHPDAYEKLQTEVDRYYPPSEDIINTAHHSDMNYLTAVINETLRLFPSVPGCTQREVPPNGPGTTVGSHYIPPGTKLWLHAYLMQRDPRNFSPAPDTFCPERWLMASGGPESESKTLPGDMARVDGSTLIHNEDAFIPFSYGPMNCVGKNLALQEMKMVVCAIIQSFYMRPAREGWTVGEYQSEFRDYFLTTRGKVRVILERRPGCMPLDL